MFHVSLLKPYIPGGARAGPPDPIIDSAGEEVFEVETIVDHRSTRGKAHYRVRWKCYDAREDLWMTEADLQDASAVLKAYKRAKSLE